jgi:hypothetical protein
MVATLTHQQRHVLAYLTVACEAALCGARVPSLRPMPHVPQQVIRPAAYLDPQVNAYVSF